MGDTFGPQFELDHGFLQLITQQMDSVPFSSTISTTSPDATTAVALLETNPAAQPLMWTHATSQIGSKPLDPYLLDRAVQAYRSNGAIVSKLIAIDEIGNWVDSPSDSSHWTDLFAASVFCRDIAGGSNTIDPQVSSTKLEIANYLHTTIRKRLEQDDTRPDMTLLAIMIIMAEVWPELPAIAKMLNVSCTIDDGPLSLTNLMLTLLAQPQRGSNLERYAPMLWYVFLVDAFAAADHGIPPQIPLNAVKVLSITSTTQTFSQDWWSAAKALAETARILASQVASAKLRKHPLPPAALEMLMNQLDTNRSQISALGDSGRRTALDDLLSMLCTHCYLSLEGHVKVLGIDSSLDRLGAMVVENRVGSNALCAWWDAVQLCCSPRGGEVLRLGTGIANMALGCAYCAICQARTGPDKADLLIGCNRLLIAIELEELGPVVKMRLSGLQDSARHIEHQVNPVILQWKALMKRVKKAEKNVASKSTFSSSRVLFSATCSPCQPVKLCPAILAKDAASALPAANAGQVAHGSPTMSSDDKSNARTRKGMTGGAEEEDA